jgi:EmrB/QacA subfamily drug resistance transporter
VLIRLLTAFQRWRGKPRPGSRLPKGTRVIPFIVAFGFLLEGVDSTGITTAIPDMAASLKVSPVSLNLAITAYILSLAVFIPISGWIADRFGARRVFCAAIAVFTLGSVACGFANSLPMLIGTRVLQGIGGAMMTPVGRLILLRTFPREQLVIAMAYMSIPALVGPMLGPLVGGALSTYAGWRWIFFINVPLGLLGITLGLRFVRDTVAPTRTRFDATGFLICGVALAMFQFTLENVGKPAIPGIVELAVAAGAGLCIALYVWHARRRADPVLDLHLFEIRTFRIANVAGLLSRGSMNAVPFMLPLLLQIGFGYSAIESGAITFLSSLGAFAVKPVSATLLRNLGFCRLLTWNAVAGGFGIAGFAMFGPETSHWLLLPYVMAFGVLRTTQFSAINGLGYSEIPPELLSRSVSLGSVTQQLSNGFGVSVSAALLQMVSQPGMALTTADFHKVFVLMGLFGLTAALGFMRLTPADGVQVSGHRIRRPHAGPKSA